MTDTDIAAIRIYFLKIALSRFTKDECPNIQWVFPQAVIRRFADKKQGPENLPRCFKALCKELISEAGSEQCLSLIV